MEKLFDPDSEVLVVGREGWQSSLLLMSRHCELFWDRRIHLLQWRNIIKALEDVCIENGTVVFCHFQSRMPQELLQSECVSSTVYQILSCKGMTELVKRSALNAVISIITSDWQTKCVFSELFSMFSAEKIVGCLSASDLHILTKILRQCGTKRNYLYLACFGVPKSDLSAFKVYIPILDISDCWCATATIQEKLNDDPASIFYERTGCRGPF